MSEGNVSFLFDLDGTLLDSVYQPAATRKAERAR